MKRILLICFVLMSSLISEALAQRTVTGQVVSAADSEGLPGVAVRVKGTSTGVTTDFDGNYRLTVPEGDNTLVFSFVGYETKEETIGNRSVVDVSLEEDVRQLQEVVVTAFGMEREKKALGYAVTEVQGEELVQARETNVVSALSGKVAGVQVTNSSGAAGAAAYIKIRGNASMTGNNQPLFVVDGVPINNDQLRTEDLRGGVSLSNRLIDLNPDDIAEMTVLKGGSAAALYGSRGANGVIVITTKKGAFNKDFEVNYSGTIEGSRVNKLPGYQTTYSQGIFGEHVEPTGTPSLRAFSWGPAASELGLDTYNNVEDFFQTGWKQENAVNVSGGRDNVSYFASVSRLDQKGIVPLNDFERTSVRLSSTGKIGEKFTLSGSANFTNSGGRRIQQGSNVSGLMLGLLRTPPTFDNSGGASDPSDPAAYQNPDGSQRNYQGGLGYDNPYWTINQNPFEDNVNRIMGYINMKYDFTDWLNLGYRLGVDNFSDKRKQVFAIGSRSVPAGQIIEDAYFYNEINSDLLLNANRNFGELGMSLTLGQNMNHRKTENITVDGNQLVIPGFYNLSNAQNIVGDEDQTIIRTTGLFLDANFDYQATYFLTLTGRREGASTFGAATDNTFFYPSVSGAIVFSEFLQDADWLTFAKVRASMAEVGNQPSPYITKTYFTTAEPFSSWGPEIEFPFNNNIGYTLGNAMGNAQLRPERVVTKEIGLDMKFLEDRIGFDVTYYDQQSLDQIFAVPVASSTGFTSRYMNAGTMENKGVEASLYLEPVRINDFSWSINANFTRNRNKVVELAEGVEVISLPWGFTGANQRLVEGEAYGTLYGSDWLRDDAGNVQVGLDGYPIVDPEEQVVGDPNPDWLAGIRNTFQYKGLMLTGLLDIRKGGDVWNGTRGAMYYFGTHEDTAEGRGEPYVFDGVYVESGENALEQEVQAGQANTVSIPKDENWYTLGPGSGFTGPSSPFIEDGGWVRLREVTLTYDFSNLISQSVFKRASFSLTGRNLLLWTDYTGIDPETNLAGSTNSQGADYFNMPNTKGISATLRLTL